MGKPGFAEEAEILGTTPLVLVADGDPSCRAHLVRLLEGIGCGTTEAENGREVLEVARKERPAVVLLEVNMPGLSGYEVCRELREAFGRELPIIFVSGQRTESFDRVAGLLLGADDYIVKPFHDGELLARIRTHLRRFDPVPRIVGNGSRTTVATLTDREREVLELLARGLTQVNIADRLVISPKTVGTHIQRILGKLGVHSRAQAVALAHEEGLATGGSLIDVHGHVLTMPLS